MLLLMGLSRCWYLGCFLDQIAVMHLLPLTTLMGCIGGGQWHGRHPINVDARHEPLVQDFVWLIEINQSK